MFQLRCLSIFRNKDNQPCGFAIGSIEGRVGVQMVETSNTKETFTFKCHRSAELVNGYQEIFAVSYETYYILSLNYFISPYPGYERNVRTSEVQGGG